MKKNALIFAALLLLSACEQPAEPTEKSVEASAPLQAAESKQKGLFDVREIVLKPRKQVELFTGAALGDCENNKNGLSCHYEKDGSIIDVVYINGVADWITITNPKFEQLDVPYQLGMDYEKSTSMTDAVIEYNGKFGFQSLTVFKSGAAVDYVYIKAKTL